MSIFGNILSKLGLKKDEPAPAARPAPAVKSAPPAAKPAVAKPVMAKPVVAKPAPVAARPAPAAAPAVGAIPVVDVVGKLEQMAAKSGRQLNWKVSIVDLLTLLGLDSSFAARKELATELGCPAENMSDSARMNVWLHKTVLQKLAEHGGNIPPELLQ